MLGTIIYILGIVAAVWCVLDIFKHDKLELRDQLDRTPGLLLYHQAENLSPRAFHS